MISHLGSFLTSIFVTPVIFAGTSHSLVHLPSYTSQIKIQFLKIIFLLPADKDNCILFLSLELQKSFFNCEYKVPNLGILSIK